MTIHTRAQVEGLLNTELQAYAQQWLIAHDTLVDALQYESHPHWAADALDAADETLADAELALTDAYLASYDDIIEV